MHSSYRVFSRGTSWSTYELRHRGVLRICDGPIDFYQLSSAEFLPSNGTFGAKDSTSPAEGKQIGNSQNTSLTARSVKTHRICT